MKNLTMSRQQVKIAKMADWADKGTTPLKVLNRFELKTMQRAILNCLQVSDVIANLPTGFGKSLLFQYPASLQKVNKNCIIVVVPLKALIWDTIRQARELGITAEQIDYSVITDYYRNDTLPQMLLATPEKIFATESTFSFIQSLHSLKKVRLLVIDECHCISEWGHDFRPAYLQLQKLREALDGVRLLAISATITPETRADLSRRLFLQSAHYFQASYHRDNLFYEVLKCKQKAQFKNVILNYLKVKKIQNEFGIIYCQTITAAQTLSKELQQLGLNVGLFHSKLSEKMRKQTYDSFMEGNRKIIVGTICFGMGINKKNIRFVINVGVSKSPQNYYQESGRAGRDGLPAYCTIISFPNQTNSISFLIGKGTGTAKQKSHQILKLQEIQQYADEERDCRRTVLFRRLGENFKPALCEKMCDNCNRDHQQNVKKIDFYKEAKKILQDLQASKSNFTKKQLCGFLKGKSVNSTKRGRVSELKLGEETKGILSKEKMQTIQKIVEGMISKRLICRNMKNFKSRYVVNYYKAANKNSTRAFSEFSIAIPLSTGLEKSQSVEKKNKFDRFLQKKGASQLKPINKASTLEQLTLKTQNQPLLQADVVKEKQDYESFFCDLFGSQLCGDLENKSNGQEIQSQLEEEQKEPNQQVQQYQDEKCLPQQNLNQDQRSNPSNEDTKTLTQILMKPQDKPKIQNLKRNRIDVNRFENNQE